MFIKCPITEITGLTQAGTTDGSGAWNTNVDLSAFVTVPANATGVILSFFYPLGFGDGFWGIREPGKTTPSGWFDPSNDYRYMASAISADAVDIYIDPSTSVYIVGFLDEDVTWFDQDATPPVLEGFGGGGNADYDLPAGVTAGSSGVIVVTQSFLDVGVPGGSSSDIGDGIRGFQVLPVVSGQTRYYSFGDIPILAEVASGAFDSSNYANEVSPVVSDGTWRLTPTASTSGAGALVGYRASNNGFGFGIRSTEEAATGNVSPTASAANYLSAVTALDTSNNFEYNIESGDGTESLIFMGAMSEGSLSAPVIRKSSTFDIETTLGTITTATLNSVNVFDHVTGQAGATVSFEGAATDEITTSGEYTLTLGDGAGTEDITVQVNVVGLASFNINKDGADQGSLTDVEFIILTGAAGSRAINQQITGITTTAGGDTGTIEITDTALNVDDTITVVQQSPTVGGGLVHTATLELI